MSWSHLLGHHDRIDAFRQIIARHRLAHAYLFVGPTGVGKRLFARELAKALLCEKNPRELLDACDHCDACLLVNAGTHPDLFQIGRPEDKNEFPIDTMKEFLRDFSLKPARALGKIGIIDDADDFNEESANAFLKTLEEPAPGTLFLLIGTSIDRQLSTIKSRCQMVRFAPLPDEPMRTLLQKQRIDDPVMLARLIRLSAGSPGQAPALADEALWQFRGDLLKGFAQPKVDSVALGKAFVEFAEDAGKETALQRRRASQMLRLLIESFTDVLRLQAGGTGAIGGIGRIALVGSTRTTGRRRENSRDSGTLFGDGDAPGSICANKPGPGRLARRDRPIARARGPVAGALSGIWSIRSRARSKRFCPIMKHAYLILTLCFAAGCSTNPVADTCDYFCPGKMYPNKVLPYGGVNIPQGPIVPPMPSIPGVMPLPGAVPPPIPLPPGGRPPAGVQLQTPSSPDFPPLPPTPPNLP